MQFDETEKAGKRLLDAAHEVAAIARGDQEPAAIHAAADVATSSGGGGHRVDETPTRPAASPEETIKAIRYWHRRRVFMMDQRKRSDLALGAFLRGVLGWSKDLPKAESDALKARAKSLVKTGEAISSETAKADARRTKAVLKYEAKPTPAAAKKVTTAATRRHVEGEQDVDFVEWSDVIMAALAARAPVDSVEARAKEEMDRLGRLLPVWPWFAENVFSGSAVSLAVIVAEAGDIGTYANPGKLWKRMGVAPITKGDATRAGSTWRKGGLTKPEWTDAGYSMRRRSLMFVIGDSLLKGKSYLRAVYDSRKEYERARAEAAGLKVAPSAKIPAKRAAEFMSDGHIHRRAQRYMEKRLLRDLWSAWRAASPDAQPSEGTPLANLSADEADAGGQRTFEAQPCCALGESLSPDEGERSATGNVEPTVVAPSAPIPATAGERQAVLAAIPSERAPAAQSHARAVSP